jgi:hypothetical protein
MPNKVKIMTPLGRLISIFSPSSLFHPNQKNPLQYIITEG